MRTRFPLIAASLLALASMQAQELNPKPTGKGHIKNSGNGNQGDAGTGGAGTTGNGINYNGGPVILGTTHMYYIWYGTWDASSIGILTDFANNIGGSPYFNINTSYFDGTGTNVSNSVTFNGSTTDNYSLGKALSDSNIASIVSSALTSGRLPTDTNAVYFVLTAPDVQETSGFTTVYCGWHTYNFLNGKNIKYSFVGNAATQNLGACAAQTGSSPNGNPGADAMVSVIAHELEEAVTDPNLNAWYDSSGQENADKCAWTFGTTYAAGGGGFANMKLGPRDYLIQRNWVNAAGGYCALSYTASPDYSLSVSPTSQSVNPGSTTGNYTVTVTDTLGFAGTVSFTVTGLPAGATANGPAPTATTSTFTISTTSAVAPGTYQFSINGSSSGLNHSVNATLVVTKPDYTITVSPTSQTVPAGGTTGNYTVTVHPVNGFSGSVALSVSGLPAGATASNPGSTTSTATFTISTLASLTSGSYPFTITGTSPGLSHTTSGTLVVNPVGTFTVTLSPSPVTVKRGNTANFTVTVTPAGGFTGNVQLSVSGLPSRASSSLSTNPVTGGAGTSTLQISTRKNTQTGSFTVRVTGTSGTLSSSGTATLTVTN